MPRRVSSCSPTPAIRFSGSGCGPRWTPGSSPWTPRSGEPESSRTGSAPTRTWSGRWTTWCAGRGGGAHERGAGMSFQYPAMLVVAAVVCTGLVAAYHSLQRERARALAAAGLNGATSTPSPAGKKPGWAARRRHIPPTLFLAALTVLLLAAGRPQATVPVPRVAGTVILAFDVSNSMVAEDVTPTRLAAAQAAAIEFVESQPD